MGRDETTKQMQEAKHDAQHTAQDAKIEAKRTAQDAGESAKRTAEDASENAKGYAEAAYDKLAGAAAAAAEAVGLKEPSAAEQAKENTKEVARDAGETIGDKAQQAKEAAGNAWSATLEKADDIGHQLGVRDHKQHANWAVEDAKNGDARGAVGNAALATRGYANAAVESVQDTARNVAEGVGLVEPSNAELAKRNTIEAATNVRDAVADTTVSVKDAVANAAIQVKDTTAEKARDVSEWAKDATAQPAEHDETKREVGNTHMAAERKAPVQ